MAHAPIAIPPAALDFAADGTPRSALYDDVYHSAHGGREQARHVFLGGNGLPERWRGRESFTVVETGFGLGLNFLETWRALAADPAAPRRLNFVSVEQHPLTAQDVVRVHAQDAELAPLARELAAAWPPLARGFHRLHLAGGRITLTLLFGDAGAMLAGLEARADAIYLDGFAPARNPAMWSPAICTELARLAAPGATLATWTVAGTVRDALARAGFELTRRAGFAHKREMLVGHRPGSAAATTDRERRAIVVGAGLAGTSCAERLAARGWEVTLIERHAAPAQEASGNPAGLLRPVLNLRDHANARLSRAALAYALAHLARLEPNGLAGRWAASGVLHLALDEATAARQREIVTALGYPVDLVRCVNAAEGGALAGAAVQHPGWWFERAAWADPAAVCRAGLAAHGGRIATRFARAAAALAPSDAGWTLRDGRGEIIAAAPVAVLATAHDCNALWPQAGIPLSPVRGQVTVLPPAAGRALRAPVCGDGYVAPVPGGGFCAGATFQHDDFDLAPRADDHAANLARLARLLPGFAAGLDPAQLTGRAALRAQSPDRMPVFGALAPGLFVATGLGARGLVWAPLGAELIASLVAGDPLPVERELVAAVAPQRFAGDAA